jgi:hypothetical protein
VPTSAPDFFTTDTASRSLPGDRVGCLSPTHRWLGMRLGHSRLGPPRASTASACTTVVSQREANGTAFDSRRNTAGYSPASKAWRTSPCAAGSPW